MPLTLVDALSVFTGTIERNYSGGPPACKLEPLFSVGFGPAGLADRTPSLAARRRTRTVSVITNFQSPAAS